MTSEQTRIITRVDLLQKKALSLYKSLRKLSVERAIKLDIEYSQIIINTMKSAPELFSVKNIHRSRLINTRGTYYTYANACWVAKIILEFQDKLGDTMTVGFNYKVFLDEVPETTVQRFNQGLNYLIDNMDNSGDYQEFQKSFTFKQIDKTVMVKQRDNLLGVSVIIEGHETLY